MSCRYLREADNQKHLFGTTYAGADTSSDYCFLAWGFEVKLPRPSFKKNRLSDITSKF